MYVQYLVEEARKKRLLGERGLVSKGLCELVPEQQCTPRHAPPPRSLLLEQWAASTGRYVSQSRRASPAGDRGEPLLGDLPSAYSRVCLVRARPPAQWHGIVCNRPSGFLDDSR